jgi:hypothetical protein
MNIKFLKYFICFTLFASLFLSIDRVYSQTNLLSKKVTVEFQNTKLENAVNILNKKLDHILSFKNKIFPKNKLITLKFTGTPLKEVLDKILAGTNIKYFESGRQIILKLVPNDDKNSLNQTDDDSIKLRNGTRVENALLTSNQIIFTGRENEDMIFSTFLTDIKRTSNETKIVNISSNAAPESITMLNEPPIYYFSNPEEEIITPKVEESKGMQLKGSSAFSISPGVKTNSTMVAITNGTNISTQSGFTGFFSYGYWFAEEWQIHLQAGVFVAEANITTTNVSAKSIIPLLFGIRYYPSFLSFGDFGKTYFGLSAGAYIGAGVNISGSITTTQSTEAKQGFETIMGLDLFLTNWLKIGPSVAYHKFGDYSKIVSETKNYSGAEFALNMGIVL